MMQFPSSSLQGINPTSEGSPVPEESIWMKKQTEKVTVVNYHIVVILVLSLREDFEHCNLGRFCAH